ncbi:MAG: helix-turn-helix transcriptional regulator [Erysipelotrichaceae bacterium]|nr:helix-turn-helix domain-containing protein [Solobacterium sp.]MDO5122089.1 helix-turn-helix transcriptional regulator [Erysipelotrichaceae bacterium]
MNQLGEKIARKRKDLGMTQNEFADKMCVTRQTVSRWEAGTVYPDIDKISDIAELLHVSCDYLLKDDAEEENPAAVSGISRLLKNAEGKTVRFSFFDAEADPDLYKTDCRIIAFEGNWMKVEAETKKGTVEKLVPVSSVLSLEFVREDA